MTPRHRHPFATAIMLLAAAVLAVVPGPLAARSISLIRDAEIEHTVREITNPILEAAGLGRDSVRIYIVNDDELNAFVAGGMNLFVNTGLLMRSQNADQLAGVIAHEVGHIAGGHLSRAPAAQKRATAEAILATVLGIATAVVVPGLGQAIIAGGQTYAQGDLMRFSRGQEQAADQAAMTYLDRIDVSAEGLAEFFKILENQNVLAVSRVSPFLLSHPLTRDRIAFVENHARRHPRGEVPPNWREGHARMVAKLNAFLRDPREMAKRYSNDDSLAGHYGYAIALYRLPDLEGALDKIDGLIAERPDDPYFRELKGQMLFENGRVAASIEPYREAVRLAPDAPLLRIGLAQSLIESDTPEATREAIVHLKEATRREPANAGGWRLLGVAQGRDGQVGLSDLSFAEYALLTGKEDDARLYAKRAEGKIDPSDPSWLRLQDILRVIEEG